MAKNTATIPTKTTGSSYSAAQFEILRGFVDKPTSEGTTFDDLGTITVDHTEEFSTVRTVTGSTHTLTFATTGNIAGNYYKVRYTFDVDCTLTLTNLDTTGSTLGTVNPIAAGTYDLWMFTSYGNVALVIQNNTGTTPATLSTPTLVLSVGDEELGYIITNIDTNATAGVLEYSTDNTNWNTWGSYSFGTEAGNITGLTNDTLYYVRYRNSASGYIASDYATAQETPSAQENQALRLIAASSQTAYILNPTGLAFGNSEDDQPFSISMWIKANDLSELGRPIYFGTPQEATDNDNTTHYSIQTRTDGTVRLLIYNWDNGLSNLIYADSTGAIVAGAWYHIVATYDGSNAETGIELYVNGSLGTTAQTEFGTYEYMPDGALTNRLTIGAITTYPDNTQYFNGRLDDVAIWNKELSGAEVTDLYNSGGQLDVTTHSAYAANCVSLWRFEGNLLDTKGSNNLTADGASLVIDVI
jgi:hypothetical protein